MRSTIFLLLALPAAVVAGPGLRGVGPDAKTGSSAAVVVDESALVHTTQLFSSPGKTPADEFGRLLGRLKATLELGRPSPGQAVKLNVHVARPELVEVVHAGLAAAFKDELRPAVCISIGTQAEEKANFSLDAVAVAGRAAKGEAAQVVRPRDLPADHPAPVAVLPAGSVIYVSGQAERGKTLADSTRLTLASLKNTLTDLGRDLSHVVQVKAFVHPMGQIADVKKEIVTFFGEGKVPPVVLVEWMAKDSIEIELVAAGGPVKAGAEPVEYLTPKGMKASPVFSRVARVNGGKRIYLSGLTGKGSDGAAQVKDVFARMKALLKECGSDLDHLAKATYLVSTDDASNALNRLRPDYYDPKRPPAASKAPQRAVADKRSGLCLDMIAVAPARGK